MNQGNGFKKNPNEVGVAWLKQSPRGDEYISIRFDGNALANLDLANCFVDMYPNTKKTNPKAPDYRILAKPRGQQAQAQAPAPAPRSAFPRAGSAVRNHAPQAAAQEAPGWDDDDPGY